MMKSNAIKLYIFDMLRLGSEMGVFMNKSLVFITGANSVLAIVTICINWQ